MADEHKLNRRQFIGAAGAAAGAAALSSLGPLAPAALAAGRLIPDGRLGTILFTQRDAISRDPTTSDLPSGFREVLEFLAGIGFKQIEFAGYRQHANAEGGANLENVAGATLLRQWLDDNELVANGNHGFIPGSWPLTQADIDRFKSVLELANILGMAHLGTDNDPTGSAFKADWDVAAEKWNALGAIAAAEGIKLYTHNHDAAYNFLLDSPPLDDLGRPTRSSGIRRLEYFFGISDPKLVWFELDIFWAHVAQHRWISYTAPDGSTVFDTFDPTATVVARTHRFPLFHAKDGVRTTDPPGVGQGYTMVPFGTGDIDFASFFSTIGQKGYHHPNYEQDNAPAWPDRGSLGASEISVANMRALTG
jgi:sugar phosphate isomerase/epimerase